MKSSANWAKIKTLPITLRKVKFLCISSMHKDSNDIFVQFLLTASQGAISKSLMLWLWTRLFANKAERRTETDYMQLSKTHSIQHLHSDVVPQGLTNTSGSISLLDKKQSSKYTIILKIV